MARKKNSQSKRNKQGNNGGALVKTSTTMFRPPNVYESRPKKSLVSSGLVVNSRFRRTSGGRGKVGGRMSALPPILAAYVDPWSPEADGVRYPDSYRGLSGTFASTLEGRMATPAAGVFTDPNMSAVTPLPGTALALFTPDPSNLIVTGVCGDGSLGGVNAPDGFHWPNGILFTNATGSLNAFGPGSGLTNQDIVLPNISPMREMYSAARLVAGGIKLTGTMNFSTVSGTIHLAPVFVSFNKETNNNSVNLGVYQDPTLGAMQNGWQTTLPSTFADMCNLPGYASFPLSALESDEAVAIFKRAGEEALLFKPTATAWCMDDATLTALRYGNSNNPNNYGHYCILVFIDNVLNSTGGPAAPGTALIETQVRCHYECQMNPASSIRFNATQSLSGIASQAPPYQPLLLAAVDNLSADVPAVRCVDDAGVSESRFVDEVARAWKGAVSVAASVATAVDIGAALLGALTI